MALPKIRDLAKYGVVTDVDPFDLPLGAWSMAVNIRFEDGRVQSSPVWRNIKTLSEDDPRFVYSTTRAASKTYVGYLDGTIKDWSPAVESDVSLSGYTPSSVEATWTSCLLAEVAYINREDRPPWGITPSSPDFTTLTDWDSDWTCKVLRAYNSALIALNVSKGAVDYPTMVKTSDIVTDPGVMPPSWDHSDPTTNATENNLTEMKGALLDALPFGNSMILYTSQEAWQMVADGSDNVYAYDRLQFDNGVINTNCVVAVDNKHYGFGPTDIWVHDGTQQVSIADGRVRKFVYASMNAKKSDQFFVSYNPNKREIGFHFISGDPYIKFSGTGCNRVAVFSLSNSTWTFDDAPLVFAATNAQVTLDTQTWSNVTQDWNNVGGTWQDLEDGFKRVPIYVGEASALYGFSSTMYAKDSYGVGSVLNSPADPNANKGSLLLREGIDLDEVDADLRDYKHFTGVYPQGRLDPSALPVTFTVGVSDYQDVAPMYGTPQTWNAREDYRLDFVDGGRFLALKVTYPDYKTMSLSGFDLEFEVTGSR